MNTGQIISGVGHLGLIGVVLFGGAFTAEPLPFTVTEVTTLSAEEFDALFDAPPSPEAVAQVDTPEPPEAGQAPELASVPDVVPEVAQPEQTETSEPDSTPEVVQPAPVEAEVSDEAPVLAPPPEDFAALVPEVAEEASPRTAPRVAPEAVEAPEPDVKIDDVDQQAVSPDAGEIPSEAEEQEETAREEAAERLETEALSAPARSLRPKSRPTRRAEPEVAEPEEPQVAEQAEPESSAVDDAVAAALNGVDEASDRTPSGPPLTFGEKDALRVSLQQCWNAGALSTDALNTIVVVAVSMNEDGTPIGNSIKLLSATGGTGQSTDQAFGAARRAILRCGAKGFPLPPEKYDQWQDIEITFNPENMRIK